MTTSPPAMTSLLRRTPLEAAHRAAGAQFDTTGDCAVATGFPTQGSRTAPAGVTLCDLSPLPRLGFKGRGTVPAMLARGLTLEAVANRAYAQGDGTVCLVLAPSEVILLAEPTGHNRARDTQTFERLSTAWRIEDEERTYPLLRRDSHVWFRLGGPRAADLLAKLCGVDLRPRSFANLAIAQTSLAKMSAIITRVDAGGTPEYHVLADTAAASYLWGCVLDAGHEFGATVTGLDSRQE